MDLVPLALEAKKTYSMLVVTLIHKAMNNPPLLQLIIFVKPLNYSSMYFFFGS
jgi:hypothetical protein